MNRLSRTVLPALAILALAAGGAQAQTVTSPFRYIERKSSLEFTAGYLFTDPELSVVPDSISAEFGPRSAPMVSARYNRRFTGPLSGNVTLSFIPSDRKVISAAEEQDVFVTALETGDEVSAPILMLEGGVRFHLTGDRTYRGLAPFLMATGGLAAEIGGTAGAERALPADERFDFGPAFAVGAGTGLDWFPTQRFSLHTELTYRIWRMSVPEGFATRRNADITEWNGNAGVSVGAAFHF